MTGYASGPISVDLERVRAAAAELKANPPSHEDIASDPKAFLAGLGIEVDAGTLSTIQTKLASNKGLASAPNQAMIIHVDS